MTTRGRLVAGMADAIVEKGFPATTVADVVRHARTSRRTFYEHFASREDCYVALLADLNEQLIARISAAVDPAADVATQVRQAVQAWIDGSEEEPALTLTWIRDSAGHPSARDIQVRSQERFVTLVRQIASGPRFRAEHELPSVALTVILVGGLRELIATQVESGEPLADIVEVAVDAVLGLLATV
ncbi:TetR family transcriptional regulator [Marmoricola endophyticus]|uniref:TetR family transcriptional regulator n=1 Tax=Marmoricola endophyticus TaxID=2040280 RepID=A0A917F4D2_9ACTN|nr:TetR/AcrR family transcriptional regulator [Marmoricola endophyticus]GGF45080.1 TetR family transcriptional regulator [Marmoricola endophyticus]